MGVDGGGRVAVAAVTDAAISAVNHEAVVAGPSFGAVVSFVGVVRDHDQGRPVLGLEYEAHPGAQLLLAQIAADVAARQGVGAVAVSHRTGALEIGDEAFVVAVSAAHRDAAFEGARELVELVKSRLPIWKLQYFGDGTSEWVNCP